MSKAANCLIGRLLKTATNAVAFAYDSVNRFKVHQSFRRLNEKQLTEQAMMDEEIRKEERDRMQEIEEQLKIIYNHSIQKRNSENITGILGAHKALKKLDDKKTQISMLESACDIPVFSAPTLGKLSADIKACCVSGENEVRQLNALRFTMPETPISLNVVNKNQYITFTKYFRKVKNAIKGLAFSESIDLKEEINDLNGYITTLIRNMNYVNIVSQAVILLPVIEASIFVLTQIASTLEKMAKETLLVPKIEIFDVHADEGPVKGYNMICYSILLMFGSKANIIEGSLANSHMLLKLHSLSGQSTTYFNLYERSKAEQFERKNQIIAYEFHGIELPSVDAIELYHYDECIKKLQLDEVHVKWLKHNELQSQKFFIRKPIVPDEESKIIKIFVDKYGNMAKQWPFTGSPAKDELVIIKDTSSIESPESLGERKSSTLGRRKSKAIPEKKNDEDSKITTNKSTEHKEKKQKRSTCLDCSSSHSGKTKSTDRERKGEKVKHVKKESRQQTEITLEKPQKKARSKKPAVIGDSVSDKSPTAMSDSTKKKEKAIKPEESKNKANKEQDDRKANKKDAEIRDGKDGLKEKRKSKKIKTKNTKKLVRNDLKKQKKARSQSKHQKKAKNRNQEDYTRGTSEINMRNESKVETSTTDITYSEGNNIVEIIQEIIENQSHMNSGRRNIRYEIGITFSCDKIWQNDAYMFATIFGEKGIVRDICLNDLPVTSDCTTGYRYTFCGYAPDIGLPTKSILWIEDKNGTEYYVESFEIIVHGGRVYKKFIVGRNIIGSSKDFLKEIILF